MQRSQVRILSSRPFDFTSMNPYESPESEPPSSSANGQVCPECGGKNADESVISNTRPSGIKFLIFGWAYLLINIAFSEKSVICKDCGHPYKYKSEAAFLALFALIVIAVIIAFMILSSI